MSTPNDPERDQAPNESGERGFHRDSKGRLCFGDKCILMTVTEGGLRFNIDPTECDPETAQALVGAVLKGPQVHVGKPKD